MSINDDDSASGGHGGGVEFVQSGVAELST